MTGALVVATLLFINNYLSLLYVQRVILLKSLYGSVGIVPVLMFGLYFFWVFVLLGSQISYAAQNVHIRTHQAMWERISHRTRETISLAAFLIIARGFASGRPPVSLDDLGSQLRIPANLLNESLQQLSEIGWATQVPRLIEGTMVPCYMPSRPLNQISLADFRHALESAGNSAGLEHLSGLDPIVDQYQQILSETVSSNLGQQRFEAMIEKKCGVEGP